VRRGLVGVGLIAAMLLLTLAGAVWAGERGGPAASGVLAAPTQGVLPGRQAVTSTPAPDGWRITGGIEVRRRDDGTWRIDLDFWLRSEAGPTATPAAPTATDTPTTASPVAPTSTPTMTSTPFPTNTPRPTHTPTWTPSPSSTPIATEEPTPTPEEACVVRSMANVNARTLPMVRSDTAIGVLPADSPVRIDAYYLEHTGDATYTWYRYWYDVDHPEAWSRADFFTERDDTPGCQLLPQVTEP